MKILIPFIAIVLLAGCSKDTPPPPSFEEQLKKDVALIDEYLLTNSVNAIKDSSGIRYVVNFEGKGQNPTSTSKVYVMAKGTVMSNSNVVVNLTDKYYTVQLGDQSALKCFEIIFPKIKTGGSFTIYSPSGYAYGGGSSADGALPPYSNMIFNISMLDEVAQFSSDTTIIRNYLNSKKIVATKDASGVSYAVSVLGTGKKPISTSGIAFTYVGKFLSTEAIFDQSIGTVTAQLSQLIKGLQLGLQQLPAGSKAVFYLPSSLAYGPTGDTSGKIPGNSVLIFEIELVSVN